MEDLLKSRRSLKFILLAMGILGGFILRCLNLFSLPRGFGYDEGLSELSYVLALINNDNTFHLSNIFIFINHPSLLFILFFSKIGFRFSVVSLFKILRIEHSIVGLFVMLLLVYMGLKLLRHDILRILYTFYIGMSVPLLICTSRIYNLTALLFFLAALYHFIKFNNCLATEGDKYKTMSWKVIFLVLLGLITIRLDIKTFFYTITLFCLLFVKLIQKKYYKLLFEGLAVLVMLFFIWKVLISKYAIEKILSSFGFYPQNLVFYLDPGYLAIDGGIHIVSSLLGEYPYVASIAQIYNIDIGLGVLGYIGLLFYPVLILFKQIFKSIENLNQRTFMYIYAFMFIAYSLSACLTKYNNPIALRHIYFYSQSILAIFIFVEHILSKKGTKILYSSTLIILIILTLLSSIIFVYKYFVFMPSTSYFRYGHLYTEHNELIELEKLISLHLKHAVNSNITIVHILASQDYRGVNWILLYSFYREHIKYYLHVNNVQICLSTIKYMSKINNVKELLSKCLRSSKSQLLMFLVEYYKTTSGQKVIDNLIQSGKSLTLNKYNLVEMVKKNIQLCDYSNGLKCNLGHAVFIVMRRVLS